MSYTRVLPQNFTTEQKQQIEFLKNSFEALFSPEKTVFGIKSIESSYILVSAYATKIFGLSRKEDVIDRFDRDLPCGAAEFAQDFIDEEKELIDHPDDKNKKKSMLNIHEYATGLKSFISHKKLIIHEPSQSILGTVAIATKINLADFFNLIPNYISEFGIQGNFENVYGPLKIGNISLTDHEHEVGFLMTVGWSAKRIAQFMNKYRPAAIQRTADTIYKYRDKICMKLNCEPKHVEDKLIGIGLNKKIPNSFLSRLIGNRPLS